MVRSRVLVSGLCALALIALRAGPVCADAGLWPFKSRPTPATPAPKTTDDQQTPTQIDPSTGMPFPPVGKAEPPRRTGPLRSCGSGAGPGLAGIGLAWGALWLGTRFVGRIRSAKRERSG
jgi:hypothetical protein